MLQGLTPKTLNPNPTRGRKHIPEMSRAVNSEMPKRPRTRTRTRTQAGAGVGVARIHSN